MEYDLNFLTGGLLLGAGVIAGFINTLAGGGSLLTLPALMIMGMPADIANATNRVSVFLQASEGVRGFNRHGMLPRDAVMSLLLPTGSGAVIGALAASLMPVVVLEPVLLTTMIAMAILIVVRPKTVAPPPGTVPLQVRESPLGMAGLFAAGLYGGFVQAGVGFILLAALTGALRYDLVRANALKMAATALFGGLALLVFVLRGQVLWIPGLLLALGAVVGVRLSVRFAISVSQDVLRWFLLAMVVAVCLAAWLN